MNTPHRARGRDRRRRTRSPGSCRRVRNARASAWRALRHDRGAGADSPTKAIALMSGCSVSAGPRLSPKPCTVLSTPAGRPASRRSRPAARGEGAPFGGLVHDRAAGGERRRDLPGRQHERRVPRRDDAHRADRLAHGVVQMCGLGRQRQAVARPARGRRRSGSSPPRAAPPCHEADRLAGVHALHERDLLGARDDVKCATVPCGSARASASTTRTATRNTRTAASARNIRACSSHGAVVVAHGEAICARRESEQLDYEGEIAMVIGKPGRRIRAT
jgi:hypothetical protein